MTDPVFYHVAALARLLNSHIAVFDLETTTFRGRPDFAIIECACFCVTPDGPGLEFSDLIDPERTISPEASRLTGITQRMVAGKEKWGERYAALFQRLASEAYVTGFNNETFDQPAVIDMNARYGQPIERFQRSFDVRKLFLTLTASKSRKGTLADVATALGVALRPNLHRALADVVLTLEVLQQLIEVYGLSAVHDLVLNGTTATSTLTAKNLSKLVKGKSAMPLEELKEHYQRDPGEVAYEVGKAIDERLVNPHVFADPAVQEWLGPALVGLPYELLASGKLKPVHDALASDPENGSFDYIQLRIAMLQGQLSWSSLKPET